MPDQAEQTVEATLLAKRILLVGAPRSIISDQNSKLRVGASAKYLCTLAVRENAVKCIATSWQGSFRVTQSDHKTELQSVIHGEHLEQCDVALSEVMFSYTSSMHSATGFTPQFLIFGEQARVPSEVIGGTPRLEQRHSGYSFPR